MRLKKKNQSLRSGEKKNRFLQLIIEKKACQCYLFTYVIKEYSVAFEVSLLGIFTTAFSIVKIVQKIYVNMKKRIDFFLPYKIVQFFSLLNGSMNNSEMG